MNRPVLYFPPTTADTIRYLLEIEPGQRVLYYNGRSLEHARQRCHGIDRAAAVASILRLRQRVVLCRRPNNRGGDHYIAIGR